MASVVNITEAVSQVNARVLAIVGVYQTTPTDTERWPGAETTDAVVDADATVCSWFLQKAGDGRRVGFLSTVSVANGGTIPNHIGEIESILLNGKMPTRSDPVTIQRDRDAALAPKGTIVFTPKIYLWGSTLVHNYTGGNATVQIADFTRNGSACQAPSEYSAAVIALAAANIIAKNGNKADAAAAYLRIGLSYLTPIARGETSLAPLPTIDETRRMIPQMAAQGAEG